MLSMHVLIDSSNKKARWQTDEARMDNTWKVWLISYQTVTIEDITIKIYIIWGFCEKTKILLKKIKS